MKMYYKNPSRLLPIDTATKDPQSFTSFQLYFPQRYTITASLTPLSLLLRQTENRVV
jgi:hypothetical protein